jgi:thiamine-phosphate pyrophosphorylase
MEYQFTPAAERVLLHAAGWSDGSGCTELTAPAMLLGLLDEPECRAATILAQHQISIQAVCQHWPELIKQPIASGEYYPSSWWFSAAVGRAMQVAYNQVAELLFPPVLETDHLLFGLVAGADEVADWLKGHGLSIQTLEADIQNRYQRQPPTETPLGDSSSEELSIAPLFTNSPTAAEDIPNPLSLIPHPSVPLLRVLDAAANRAREGLRVAEDYVRFVLDDRHLTEQCKQLRHDLAAALQCFPQEFLLAARETQFDVGTALTTAAEEIRLDAAQLLAANFLRIQESLRSLEEFGKLAQKGDCSHLPERPAGCEAQIGLLPIFGVFKQLRYRAYTLHRAVEITRHSLDRLAAARLYVLIDIRPTADEFRQLVERLIAAGVHVLQLRDKHCNDRELLERARILRKLTASTPALFIVNDRPDLAAISHADGVHLGQEEISVKDARSIVGPAALIGVSTHSIEQVRQAVLDGANYIGVGPTFSSGTKTFDHFPGLELLRAVAAEIRLPAFAIGGIDRENLDEVLQTGMNRIAVSQAVLSAPDPAAAAQEFLIALDVRR